MKCKLVVVMTCHNRRDVTVECLAKLFSAKLPNDISIKVVLVDDNSIDGTSEAVESYFPEVQIFRGDGALFWNRGMHQAQALALDHKPDFLLWLNDDTLLKSDALVRLFDTYHSLASKYRDVVVLGSTIDLETGKLTYGGSVSVSNLRRFSYRKVDNLTAPVECEVMNGNIVLLPINVINTIGNLDFVFEHGLGDIDYALRIRKAGFKLFVAPGHYGYCSHNKFDGSFRDTSLPFSLRWKMMLSRKGLPVRSWFHFTRKHGGQFWLIYFIWPYLRFNISNLSKNFKSTSYK